MQIRRDANVSGHTSVMGSNHQKANELPGIPFLHADTSVPGQNQELLSVS